MKRSKSYKSLGVWLACVASLHFAYGQIDVEHVISIGRNALHFNDYVVSISYFNQAIDSRPWMAQPYYYRAVAKINLEDYKGAAADASLCLERNQFISKAYLIRGIARQNLGQRQDAIADYRQGLKLLPNNLSMGLNLALAYSQEKAYDEAEEALSTLLRYTPKSAEAHQMRASIALERGDTTLALQRIDHALSLDSTQAMPYKLRAHIYASREQLRQSLEMLNRAIELEPKTPSLLTNRGVLHYRTNKLRAAMDDYSEALRLEPRNRVARYNRALLRTLVGELTSALSDWDEVLKQEPTNYIARYNRAILAERLGRWTDALEDLNVVLGQYPSFADGFLLRSQLRKALRDHKGAERDYWHAWDLQQNKQYRAAAYATALKNQSRGTRSAQDTEIDKYALLIEEQVDLSGHKAQYSSASRGRVQDRDTQIAARPPYFLTYFSQVTGEGTLPRLHHPVRLLEDENKHSSLGQSLKLYSEPQPLTEEEVRLLEGIIQKEASKQVTRGKHIYLHRGIAYALLQDYDQSIENLGQAIGLDEGYALAYLARALAFVRKHDLEPQKDKSLPISHLTSAKRDLDAAIRLAPTLAHAYYNRAALLAQTGDSSAAIADYTAALALSPRLAEAYFNRGLLLLSQGKRAEGLSDLSQAGELGLYEAYNIIKRISKD